MKPAIKTVPIGPFRGINNRIPDHKLATFERGSPAGDYLRNAVNVDLTDAGTLQRRPGVEKVQAGAECHSLWGGRAGALYVDGDTLYRFPRTAIRAGLTPGFRVSYCDGPDGYVYWSNGVVIERIVAETSEPLGPATPNPAPQVAAVQGGSLPPGLYLVCITAVAADGRESGSTWPVQVSVPANGVITISGLPGVPVKIYISPANGDLMFLTATTSAMSYALPVMPQTGAQCPTLRMRPVPAGHIVRWLNGRLLVVAGSTLFYSEPFMPALYNPARGRIPFPSRITIMEPCGDGVFVATTEQTYYLAGSDIDQCAVSDLLPYGAVEGTGCKAIDDMSVWWFSSRGVVIGTPDGQARNIQEKNVAVGGAGTGAALVREQNGTRQMVSSLFGSRPTIAAASSYFEAEIIRKESML